MSENPLIACRDTTWLVSDARERDLTAEETAALQDHIAGCPLCQGAATQFEVLFRGIQNYVTNGADSSGEERP